MAISGYNVGTMQTDAAIFRISELKEEIEAEKICSETFDISAAINFIRSKNQIFLAAVDSKSNFQIKVFDVITEKFLDKKFHDRNSKLG